MTAGDAFLRSGADQESVEDLTLLNNLRADSLVEAGTLLKIVEPPLSARAGSDNPR